jgi:NAD(P)-dependent dehydrogenase (short-subunit alcohol dehydrogenase family)
MFNLNQKTAVVTGAGSGIGKATAKVLARQGAVVYALDLNESALADTLQEIIQDGGQGFPLVCNVTDQVQVRSTLVQTKTINILVNCAGISHIGKADNTSEEDFDRIYQVNVKGTYNCLHEAIPYMKDKGGVILNMASIANNVGLPDRFAYSMSKGAVLGMTLSVAKDYLANGIRCNCISPARVHTPFVDGFISKTYPGQEAEMFEKLSKTQPIGRMAKPEEIANLILYLCSDEASFIIKQKNTR